MLLHELATGFPFIAMDILPIATMNFQPIYELLKYRIWIVTTRTHHDATLSTTCELSEPMSLR